VLSRLTGSRVAGYLAVAVAGTLIGAGGLALAASGRGVIHACAGKKTGALRISAHCKPKKERAISWNVRGPQGLSGPIGATGARGPQGQKGDTGSPGISHWQVVTHISADDSTSPKQAAVTCPAGTQVISTDGQIIDNPGDSVALTALITFTDGSGARADAQEVVATASNWAVMVEAICATVG
jgi:hypothetical protein